MNVVVISHNQIDNVQAMQNALVGHDYLFVFDRCTDYSEALFAHYPHIVNRDGSGFLAGRMRDLGADQFGNGPILFLDGDRVPLGPLPDFGAFGFDAVCLLCEGDERAWCGSGPIPWDNPVNPHNYVYSCGIWLSERAISVARAACEGRLFHPAFDGRWGEEDRYLGDVLRAHGLSIGYTDHPRLSGAVGGIPEHRRDEFGQNFLIRLKLSGRICAHESPATAR